MRNPRWSWIILVAVLTALVAAMVFGLYTFNRDMNSFD
jgi:hypothetical protein